VGTRRAARSHRGGRRARNLRGARWHRGGRHARNLRGAAPVVVDMSRLLTLALAALALVAVALPSGAGARRDHTVHGTVRKLCDAAKVRKWPGGPSAGRVRAGHDMRRYHFEGPWALGVTTRRPFIRGYVLVHAFCPPSARGRAAAEAARRLAAHPPAGRPGTPLARPVLRRVCAPLIYVRDHPLNRPIALLYVGDAFKATRLARNPWIGGMARGHARRRGWVPRASLCRGLDHRVPGYLAAGGPAGSTVLAPPATVPCGALVSGRRLVEVGVRGTANVAVELLDHKGRPVSSARFTHGRAGRWRYAAAGPYVCGAGYVVAYTAGGAQVRFALRVAPAVHRAQAADDATAMVTVARPASAARAANATPGRAANAARASNATAARAATTARAAAAACRSRTQKAFAHGGRGPVDHRFHARPAVSADGRRIAYDLPAAGIVPGDRNRARDVFVRDAVAGRTELVSVARGGGVGNGTSRAAAISADGRSVAFESSATDLVERDGDGVRDVFVRELRAGTTRLLGPGRSPALSADGRAVAYEAAGAIVVTDLATGTSRRVARSGYRPALSGDGRYVAYESHDDKLAPHDANDDWDVLRTDRSSGDTILLSVASDGRSRRGQSLAAVLSGDGSVAAFQSDAPLVTGDRSGLRDVFVRDVRSASTVLVSANRCGRPANGYNRYPSISADGRRVAFDSHATDLVAGAPRGRGQVYLRDLAARRTRLLSVRRSGGASARTSFSPALAARAAVVAFPSFAYDLGPRDTNRRVDIYRRSVAKGRTQLVSRP
jgi:Tol biopolymer transport system component